MNPKVTHFPHSVEAEQAVLGTMLRDSRSVDDVVDVLRDSDFYRHDHRLIFRAIAGVAERGDACDVVTVGEWLERHKDLEDAGGLQHLATLASHAPSGENLRAYIKIVRDRALLRELGAVGREIAAAASGAEYHDPSEVLDLASQRLLAVGAREATKGPRRIAEALPAFVNAVDERLNSDGEIAGLPTGLADFDRKTGGLQPGNLIIVGGRPSMGKTSLAMGWAEHCALNLRRPALAFSMEMSEDELVARTVSSQGRINSESIRNGKLQDEEWPRLTEVTARLRDAPLFIDDTPALNLMQIRARARRVKAQHGLDLVVIDYLQLMALGEGERRDLQIGDVTRGLKSLAKELAVPVVVLSQLNRGVEQRQDKRPRMSDLRESGAIEQDADLIVFVYRDEVYHDDSPERGVAELIIGKARHGGPGTVKTTFLGAYTRFADMDWSTYRDVQEQKRRRNRALEDAL